ncbi:MAG: hypothetical protein IPG17_33070 [Sandaracinaceae bacterium]|nr:hypothetical protein [Sandaracinaceae bacterium]
MGEAIDDLLVAGLGALDGGGDALVVAGGDLLEGLCGLLIEALSWVMSRDAVSPATRTRPRPWRCG